MWGHFNRYCSNCPAINFPTYADPETFLDFFNTFNLQDCQFWPNVIPCFIVFDQIITNCYFFFIFKNVGYKKIELRFFFISI